MYAEITTALASIKTAGDLVTLVLKTKVSSAVTEKAIELQSAIISLQSAILAIQMQNQELLTENNQLKQQLIDQQNWEAEAQQYKLHQINPGVFVYVSKSDEPGTELGAESNYWLCTHCFEKKQKSILQKGMYVGPGYQHHCPNCKTNIFVA